MNSNEKEIHQLKNRFHDLADKAFRQGIFTFTGFLGLAEQDIFWQEQAKLQYAGFQLNGGWEDADRVVIRFGNPEETGYEAEFPIVCVNVRPLGPRFADALSHRDFLGALMNLGIDRSTLGDIKIKESQAFVFCLDSIAAFICENLEQVKHTHVKCAVTEVLESIPRETPAVMKIQVQSLRADSCVAKVYNLSREKSLDLFRAGKVYVNGRLCGNNSLLLKEGDTVNARGFGKFRLTGKPSLTRKGKLAVEAAVYQ